MRSRPGVAAPGNRRLGVAGLLVLGAALELRLFDLSSKALSTDEAYTVMMARGTLSEIWSSLISDHVPLYFGLIWAWVRVVGDGELAVRLPSTLLGVLSLAPLILIGRTLGHPRAGLIAAGLGAISPFTVYWSQEAKPSALQIALAVWSCWLLLRASQRGGRWWWTAWWFVSLAGMYSHYYHFFVLLGQDAWLLAGYARRRAVQEAAPWALGQIGLALAFSPWLVGHAWLISRQVPLFVQPAPLPLDSYALSIANGLLAGDPAQARAGWRDPAVAVVMGLLAILGLRAGMRERTIRPAVGLFASVLASVLIGGHVLDRIAPHFQARYVLGVVPLVYLLAAWGIDAMLKTRRAWTAGLAVLVALAGSWVPLTLQTYTSPQYQHPGFREVVDYFIANRGTREIFTGDPVWAAPAYNYYLHGADHFVELPFLTLSSDPSGSDERLAAQIRAWRAEGVQRVWSASSPESTSRLNLALETFGVPTVLRFERFGAAIQQYSLIDTTAGGPESSSGRYVATVLEDRPVVYWRLGEREGRRASSTIGGINAEYQGGYVLGAPGAVDADDTAVRLNGRDGVIVAAPDKRLTRAGPVTVEAWWQPCRTLSGAGTNRWLGKIQQADAYGIGWEGWNGGWSMQVVVDGTPIAVAVPMDAPAGEWVYVAGTFDGGALRIFVNGRPQRIRQISQSPGAWPALPFIIGGPDDATRDLSWDGLIDEVAVYDHALSAESIRKHYAARQRVASPVGSGCSAAAAPGLSHSLLTDL